MATTVYNIEEVALQDDTTIELRPLNISTLRQFMKRMEELGTVAKEEDTFDILVNLAALCIKAQRPEFWDEEKNNGKDDKGKARIRGGASQALEDVLDMDTVHKILEICGGIKLNDPNLVAAATEALGKN